MTGYTDNCDLIPGHFDWKQSLTLRANYDSYFWKKPYYDLDSLQVGNKKDIKMIEGTSY